MSLEDDFKAAQEEVKTLSKVPSNEDLLALYALFKQGTAGDVTGKRPGMLDMKGRAKFDAWSKNEGIAAADAMQKYVTLVHDLKTKYG